MAKHLNTYSTNLERLKKRDRKRHARGALHKYWLFSCAILTSLLIIALISTIIYKGLPAINWEFLSTEPKEGMSEGGIWPMIRGSILLMLGTLIIVLPVGILGGVFFAEYLGDNKFGRLMRACVIALAGTPSIIYGLFGLAFFVLMMKMNVSLLAGWLTLALFSLPIIVITTENAIKSVPETFVEAGHSLGLSKWQTIRKIVLPQAFPGIITGLVLSTGRAAGEAPPILLTAGVYYATGAFAYNWEMIRKPVANLPYHLAEGYRQGGVIPEKIVWGTCLILMLFVLLINLTAIIVRARMRSKRSW